MRMRDKSRYTVLYPRVLKTNVYTCQRQVSEIHVMQLFTHLEWCLVEPNANTLQIYIRHMYIMTVCTYVFSSFIYGYTDMSSFHAPQKEFVNEHYSQKYTAYVRIYTAELSIDFDNF